MSENEHTISRPAGSAGKARVLGGMAGEFWRTDGVRLIHVAKTMIAVVLAMGLSMRLELAAPRTAMVTVVILMMHQHSGMVLARGFYRGAGMLVGNLAAIGLIGAFPQERVLFLTALVLWIGFCTCGAAYFRNYQSYGFVLAGYSTCIAAIPSIDRPYDIIANVVTGLSEVSIGILSASLVSALILPRHVSAVLMKTGEDHYADFIDFIRAALTQNLQVDEQNRRYLKLVAARAQLENLRSAAVFEDPDLRARNGIMTGMAGQFLDAAARFHALHQYRARVASAGDSRTSQFIETYCDDIAHALPAGNSGQSFDLRAAIGLADAIDRAVAQLQNDAPHVSSSSDLEASRATMTALTLLRQALDSLRAYLRDFIALRLPSRLPSSASSAITRPVRIVTAANRMVSAAAGLRATVAISTVALFWIASGWTGAAGAVISATIASALYSIMPAPAAATRQLALGCATAWLASLYFNFVLVPHLDGFASLAAALALFVMIGSYLNTFVSTAVVGLGFSIYFCFLANVTNPGVYAPVPMLDAGFSSILGIVAASLAYSVVAPYGGDWATERYLRQLRRLVSGDACFGNLAELMSRFDAGVRDFVLQIGSRPVAGRLGQRELFAWTFASLEIGRSLVDLRMASANASPSGEWLAYEHALCTSISQLFERPSYATLLAAERTATAALTALNRGLDNAGHEAPLLANYVDFILVSLQCNLIPLQRPAASPHETPQ
ncbi:FUSC family protein [Burkholderia multivorans]|uniref:FUSC family protein n=1 Tax=Burkholderia multivorans TaxID=87883 RepID=A0AB37AN29_9BURK|nr:FUSC family protein [Burkholderia multivorans]MBU9589652.1 FUSC family protein [Burkholderia multivorans]PRE39275.1 FUSC family protein [Burkholderia multivorans]PRE42303.1 FUSC family protein [Burkholderia multivorans]